MNRYNIININKNIDQYLVSCIQENQNSQEALINGITTLKSFASESGTSFEHLTYLAVIYFYEHIYVYEKKDDDGRLKKYSYKRLEETTITRIKQILDTCNYTEYTPIEIINTPDYKKLSNAKYYTECYLIIQYAYFFGSQRFGEHPYITVVENYRKTGTILPNNMDPERFKKAFKRIDVFNEWKKHPEKFKEKPFYFNKQTYLNNWYYGTLDILANIFGICMNYKYEYPLKEDGNISEYREYNKFIQTPRILRKIQPFEMVEFDIISGHLSYIDLFLGSNVSKTAYENYAKNKNISRENAKRKFQTILNLRDYRNTYKQKQKYIDTLCGFGWTFEQSQRILHEITDSPDYLFGFWATKYESEFVIKFAEANNIVGWTRGHDSLTCLKRKDIDYTKFCTSFENGVIKFELEEIVHQDYYTINSVTISPVETFDDKLNYIKNEVNKFERVKAEILDGYLSEKLCELIPFWSCSHINILSSPASSGKTSMVLKLREMKKKCLLVVPTQAIIKNKHPEDFVQVFGTIEIQKYIKTEDSIICTFDKFSQIKPEDYAKFDFIFIDESHLLFTESYRMHILVLLLKNIEKHILNVRK